MDYLLIIPEGYEERFLAAENAEEIPAMEAIISYSSLSGAYVDEVVNEYTSLLHTLALSEGTGMLVSHARRTYLRVKASARHRA